MNNYSSLCKNDILKELLFLLFDAFNKQNIDYVILRNYEQLPDYLREGGDIDFLVDSNSYSRIKTILKNLHETEILIASERLVVKEFIIRYKEILIIKLDFHPFEDWHGAIYLNSNGILANKIRYKSFYVPCEFHQALTMLMSSYLHGGFIKQKYMNYVKPILANIKESEDTISTFGHENINSIKLFAKGIIDDKTFLSRRKKIIIHIIRFNIKRYGLNYIKLFIQTRLEEIAFRFKYKGAVIELATQDCDETLNEISSFFKAFVGEDRLVIINKKSSIKERILTWDAVGRLKFIIFIKGDGALLRTPDLSIKNNEMLIPQLIGFFKHREADDQS